jgi:transcriptional regulator with XRE-family HTH domain
MTTNDIHTEFGASLKRFRTESAMTQAAFAELFGVDTSTVSRWERGRDKPGLSVQRQLRALVEPTAPGCPSCRVALGLLSAFVQGGHLNGHAHK